MQQEVRMLPGINKTPEGMQILGRTICGGNVCDDESDAQAKIQKGWAAYHAFVQASSASSAQPKTQIEDRSKLHPVDSLVGRRNLTPFCQHSESLAGFPPCGFASVFQVEPERRGHRRTPQSHT